jgi:hypothetical protein
MTEWYYIPSPITCPELKGPGLLDEIKKIERLDDTRLRKRK